MGEELSPSSRNLVALLLLLLWDGPVSPAPALTPEPGSSFSSGLGLTLPVPFLGTGPNPGGWTKLPPVRDAQGWQHPPNAEEHRVLHVCMYTHVYTCTHVPTSILQPQAHRHIHTCPFTSCTHVYAHSCPSISVPNTRTDLCTRYRHTCTQTNTHVQGDQQVGLSLRCLLPEPPLAPCLSTPRVQPCLSVSHLYMDQDPIGIQGGGLDSGALPCVVPSSSTVPAG